MKKFFLPILFLFMFFLSAQAQMPVCMPDTTGIPDTAFGVYPLPYLPDERPMGGITDTVCLNKDFDFTFTIKVGDTLTVGTITAAVSQVSLATNGALTFDPPLTGISYTCNPPNCVFKANEPGCVLLSGKVTNAEQIGRHELKLTGSIMVTASGFPLTLPISFPNQEIPELRGNYYLFLQEENSPYCSTVSSTYAVYAPEIEINNRPNPFSDFTQIQVKSREQGNFNFRVLDMLGKIVHRETINLHLGENIIDFDGRSLPNGIYVYTISDAKGGVSGKMLVNRQ